MSLAETPDLRPLGSSRANQWHLSSRDVNMMRETRTPRPVTVPIGKRSLTFDLTRTAMVVVDMQNDFCHPDGWLAHIGVDVGSARTAIAPLAQFLPLLREANVPVIWLNWGNRPDRLNLGPSLHHVYNPTGYGTGLGDPIPGSGAHVLERGSWSAQVVDELTQLPADIRIDKFRMSGFPDTELDSILRNLGVTTLMFGGVNIDQCVMCTLQDANFLGYDCILISDCCATTSPQFCHEATVYNVNQCFGFVVQSTNFVAALARV